MYMKRILTILASVAMVMAAVSCNLEQKPEISFGKAQYVLLADAPLVVDVVTNIAPVVDLTLELSFTGTAAMDTDYTVDAMSIVIPAGQTKGSVTITPMDNYESDKNIIIALTALPARYEYGKNDKANVAVDAKETLIYSFSAAQANLLNTYTVKLNLSGSESGNDWVATETMEIPFTITPALDDNSVLVPEDDMLVVEKGSNVATVVLTVGEFEGDPQNFVIEVDAEAAGVRFRSGINSSITITVCGDIKLPVLVGTWEFVEVLALEEIELFFADETEDPEAEIAALPTHNDGFKFTIAENNGKYTLTPSAEGDWTKYFKECEIDYREPINICSDGSISGAYTAVENNMFVVESEELLDLSYTYFSLSSAYRNFDGNAVNTGTGAIAITYDADNNLIVALKDYDTPPFGELWWDDEYFDSDMFSFASRFAKVQPAE